MTLSFLEARSPAQLWDLLATHGREDHLILIAHPDAVKHRLSLVQALAMDFDHTAAIGGHHPKSLDHLVDPSFAHLQAARQPAHTDGMVLTVPDDEHDRTDARWIEQNIAVWVAAGMRREHFRQGGAQGQLRAGARELIRHFGSDWTVIISMGFADIIQVTLELHGVPCEVAATYLRFVAEQVHGLVPGSQIVTGSRKGDELERFARRRGLKSHEFLVLGDSFGDRKLFQAGGVRGFVIPRLDSGELDLRRTRREAIELLWPHLDLVITGTLLPVYNFVAAVRPH